MFASSAPTVALTCARPTRMLLTESPPRLAGKIRSVGRRHKAGVTRAPGPTRNGWKAREYQNRARARKLRGGRTVPATAAADPAADERKAEMYPELFRIGDFAITTFGLMMFLAFVTAAWITGKQLKRYGLPKELAWDLLAWVAVGGILDAKLYHIALNFDALLADPLDQLLSRGGLVWYGGLIGGVTAYYLQIRKRALPLATMYDATAPALALAYAVGRLGCFLVGDDYGRYTDGPL